MYVFSENFRGSPDGWSNLLDANFLVGENSTGKSSFGRLLKLIWSVEFQYNNSCIIRKYSTSEFGDYYSKITSAKNKIRTFTIAYLSEGSTDPEADVAPIGKMISYIETKGDIGIRRISILRDGHITSVAYDKRTIYKSVVSYSKRFSLKGLAKKFSDVHYSKLESESWEKIIVPGKKRPPTHLWNLLLSLEGNEIRDGEKYRVDTPVLKSTGLLRYLGPIRQRPERVYFVGTESEDPEGKGSLNRMKRSSANASFKKAMNRFGKESGMFDEFRVVDLSKHVEKNAFSIKFVRNGVEFYTDELGFGVSQVIPLLVETIIKSRRPVILLEQPELHLHPKAQAAFGKLLFEFSKSGSQFIVETHSDFIIDRFRISLANGNAKSEGKPTSQVMFFSNKNNKNVSSVVPILSDGNYLKPPRAYRRFFLNEELEKFNAL